MAGKRKVCEDDLSDQDDWCEGSVSDEGQGFVTRKRRRGMIEKKRRDRINDSLNELRKLVPTALEKSSSTKLEKAEILQMTVEHLRMLPTRGDASDPRLAMEYHAVGFRECVSEVSRYLLTVEGLDIHNSLCIRLMAHLNTFSSYQGWTSYTGGENRVTPSTYPLPSYHGDLLSYQPHHHTHQQPRTGDHTKHYRPWGPELHTY